MHFVSLLRFAQYTCAKIEYYDKHSYLYSVRSTSKVFGTLRDPRVDRNKKHNLLDVIALSILAVLCGADSYDEIEFYGNENFAFLLVLRTKYE